MSEDDAWGTRGSGRREGGGSKDDGVALQRLGDPIVDRDSSPWEHGPEVNNPTAAIWNPLVPMKSILPMENDGGIGTRDEPAYEADFFLEYMPDVNKALAHTKATLPFNGERDDGSSIPIGRFTLREKLQNALLLFGKLFTGQDALVLEFFQGAQLVQQLFGLRLGCWTGFLGSL